ncbi:hypothetical protein BTHERMOSOX_1036 [Bathymodiolus thermophilus thioautotrophic gill symbiont]|uniref:Uncharacterized protein n=1 Tax=Bathymodiolus thermophilus thioautotrophic gill symbiont TaxID=2360 RepID=A0A1J5TW37_9GAMM|nr:hypothetical protein [Bathymodiolus thermophilus thioautotrophic gill symbiont]OIR24970.1 hypothetical protein BGC33_12290 [Bathymodiolus thermophilus thioautotrophic gill symbiont]CAB5499770.1 hypothetical protein THERMOT_1119 [Bathymodiolus thermophilus thioautotrophic gill symbiont]SHA29670.1 hypothetical protein BTHERMOSOX_1036 [Bathymodiolus thermophilus thioautotrophic gill symbiont]
MKNFIKIIMTLLVFVMLSNKALSDTVADVSVHATNARQAANRAHAEAVKDVPSLATVNAEYKLAKESAALAKESAKTVETDKRDEANVLVEEANEAVADAKKDFNATYEKTGIQGYWKYPSISGLSYTSSVFNYEGETDKGKYYCQKRENIAFSLGIIRVLTLTCRETAPTITLIQEKQVQ